MTSGAGSNATWTNMKLDIPSDINVLGYPYSTNPSDWGIDITQFPLFRLRPESIIDYSRHLAFWTKGINNENAFVFISGQGRVSAYNANRAFGVYFRPFFLMK